MAESFVRRDVSLSNWRLAPYSSWSFQNVSEIVPSAIIKGNCKAESGHKDLGAFKGLKIAAPGKTSVVLAEFLAQCHTDSFVVMRDSAIIAEWHSPSCNPGNPHIIFSISKSVTGLLAGILSGQGTVSPDDPVIGHVPEARGSAYDDATLRNLLDMETSLDFAEDYLDKTGAFDRYRRSTGWNPGNPSEPSPDLASFLFSIKRGAKPHGTVHEYRSPDTDMAGIVLERAAQARLPALISELLWKPMGAHSDAFITVDRAGTARAAGGISVSARDLARLGDLVRRMGGGVIPSNWIEDLWTGGSREAWKSGDQADLFPTGSYRSFWYESGMGELAAIGIHGQWLWIDPASKTVIVKLSSQDLPVDDTLDQTVIAMLRMVAGHG